MAKLIKFQVLLQIRNYIFVSLFVSSIDSCLFVTHVRYYKVISVLPLRYYKVLPIYLLHVDVLYYILLGLLFTVEWYDDFSTLTVGTLKDFLSLRGLSTTGKKIELEARAFSAFELKLPVKPSAEELNTKIHKEYLAHDLVDPNSTQSWIDDVTKWPRVDLGKMFCYILEVYSGVYWEIQGPESLFVLDE
jgi:hypothetical protein